MRTFSYFCPYKSALADFWFKFLPRYSKIEDYAVQAMDFLTQALENSKDIGYTFCNGMSGICWCIDHVIKQGFIDIENAEILNYFDNYLCNHARLSLQMNKNVDFLHGSIGAAFYLLRRMEIAQVQQFEDGIMKDLDNHKISINESYCWESILGEKYNIGLAHGMASICVFLSKAYNLKIRESLTKDLLEKSVSFLLAQEIKSADRFSCFPTFALLDNTNPLSLKSRMSWCYGDLGIGLAIWHCSQALQDKKLKQKAIDIFHHSASRTALAPNMVTDAGICHGTAGIALIFRRMYINTGIARFKLASEYWIEQTLSMSKYSEAPADYKADSKIDSFDFLLGIAGIGLVLLSFLTNEDSNWDECLLLS